MLLVIADGLTRLNTADAAAVGFVGRRVTDAPISSTTLPESAARKSSREGTGEILTTTPTARTLLPEVDHADRLICSASNGFEVAVEMEQGEARPFRSSGH